MASPTKGMPLWGEDEAAAAAQKPFSPTVSTGGKKSRARNSVGPRNWKQQEEQLERPAGCLLCREPRKAGGAAHSKQGSDWREKAGQRDGSVGKALDMENLIT